MKSYYKRELKRGEQFMNAAIIYLRQITNTNCLDTEERLADEINQEVNREFSRHETVTYLGKAKPSGDSDDSEVGNLGKTP